jgi:hypothetical protein
MVDCCGDRAAGCCRGSDARPGYAVAGGGGAFEVVAGPRRRQHRRSGWSVRGRRGRWIGRAATRRTRRDRGPVAVRGDPFVQGGLRLHDAETGALVVPSCCNGLADWLLVSAGLAPSSFGHDPDPQIEYVGDSVRVWPDGVGNRDRGSFAGEPVDLPRATLGTLLCAVRTDLVGFLTAVAGWTDRIGLRRPRAGTGGDDRPPVRDLGTLGPGRLATPHQILNRHAPGPPLGQDPSDRRRSPAGSMVGAVPVAAEATTGRRRSPAGSMVGAVPVAAEADHRSAAVSGRLSGRRCSSRGRGRPRPRVAPRVGGRRPCRRGPGLRVAPAPPRRPRRRARRGPGAASGTVGRPP